MLYIVPYKCTPMYSIYVLKDPDTFQVRYVGATSQTLTRRLSGHLWDSRHKRSSTRKIHWIAKLLSQGKTPVIELIETCGEDWAKREQHWYLYYALQTTLVNTNKGGGGVFKKDANSIARSSQAKFQAIVQYDLSGNRIAEWECIRDATAHYGLARNAIKNCLRGRAASSGGYVWKYRDKASVVSKRLPVPNKPVLLITPEGALSFPSVNACAKAYNIPVYKAHKLFHNGRIQHNDIVHYLRKRKTKTGGS